MSPLPTLVEWQEAERRAEAAAEACKSVSDSGGSPSKEQLDELLLLRQKASQKLKIMVEEVKATTS